MANLIRFRRWPDPYGSSWQISLSWSETHRKLEGSRPARGDGRALRGVPPQGVAGVPRSVCHASVPSAGFEPARIPFGPALAAELRGAPPHKGGEHNEAPARSVQGLRAVRGATPWRTRAPTQCATAHGAGAQMARLGYAVRAIIRNAPQALSEAVRTGPWGRLESMTATAPSASSGVVARATPMQSSPCVLYEEKRNGSPPWVRSIPCFRIAMTSAPL